MLKYSLSFSILWACIIAVLSLISGNELPSLHLKFQDKIGHFIVYAILAFFIYHASVNAKLKAPILICILVPFIFGVLMEITQGLASEVRHGDVYDAIFNGLGAIFVGLFMFLRR